MKISAMLEREDFYSILQKTLEKNARYLGFLNGRVQVKADKKDCTLFVNPKLNAIISAFPESSVTDYLKTEYNVGGNIFRRMTVNVYLWMATTFVKRFSHFGIQLSYQHNPNKLLIYPCNKKIRLFDFEHGIVHTVLKDGFPDTYIKREMAFRQERSNEFIPGILEARVNSYSERIIQGRPLARINDSLFVENCKKEALEQIQSLTSQSRTVNAKKYIMCVAQECEKILLHKPLYNGEKNVREIFGRFASVASDEDIPLMLSHGDLQPGNIWVDDECNCLTIIDWETVKERSPFYDYAALYWNLRREKNVQRLYEWVLAHGQQLSRKYDCSEKNIALTILAEELAYQTEELGSFPGNIGVKEYEHIIEQYTRLNL